MNDPTTQLIFVGLIFAAVALMSWWIIATFFGGGDKNQLRQRLADDKATPKSGSAPGTNIGHMLQSIGEAAARPFEPKTREEQGDIRKKLARAGIYSSNAARLVAGAKVICLALGLIGGYGLSNLTGNMLLGISRGGIVGYLAPVMWLKTRIKKHQLSLDRGLADAIDLLVVCVEAGLTVDSAMQRVGQELNIAHPALSREMEIAHMETRVGLARSEALKNLGNRTGNANLQGLASMLVQAERFGTSIANALRVFAESIRLKRQHAAEETAAKATVKLSFPVVLFIFPAVLIVLAGPAVLGLFKSALFVN